VSFSPCPECGNSCSLLANACPKRGRPPQPDELNAATMGPAASENSAGKPNGKAGVIECLLVVVLFMILPVLCMSGGRSTQDYAPVGADVQSNACFRACAARLSSHPDQLAPQCRNVTPESEYRKCISGAAQAIANLCLKECGLK
jgi:hypothetical protein